MYVYIERNFSCDTGSPSAETTCVGKRRMQNRARTQGHVKQRSQASTEDIDLGSRLSRSHTRKRGNGEGCRVERGLAYNTVCTDQSETAPETWEINMGFSLSWVTSSPQDVFHWFLKYQPSAPFLTGNLLDCLNDTSAPSSLAFHHPLCAFFTQLSQFVTMSGMIFHEGLPLPLNSRFLWEQFHSLFFPMYLICLVHNRCSVNKSEINNYLKRHTLWDFYQWTKPKNST